MVRLKICISYSNTGLWHPRWFESRRWEGILRKKYFSSSTPSSHKTYTENFPPIRSNIKELLTCKPVKILIPMQEERGEGRLFQHHKIRVLNSDNKKGVWRSEINCMLEEKELSCHSAKLLTTKLWIQDNYF